MPFDTLKQFILELSESLDSILYAYPFTLLQFIGGVLAVIFSTVWIYLLLKAEVIKTKVAQFKEAVAETPLPLGRLLKQWEKVKGRMQTNDESQWKLALIEADSILDDLIKALGYKGDTMGERMKKIKPGQFPRLDDAWRAHKVRNFIAHDASYKLRKEIAARTIEIYELIFNEFNILR